MTRQLLISLITLLASISTLLAQVPAFPGAEGGGAVSQGGRGGKIIEVTNLNNWGSGSFRAALKASGARTVVFRVAGTIDLEEYAIDVSNPYLTIAGQTAPGGGICIKNGDIKIKTHDVVIRYLRLRPGETPNYGASHCIFIKGEAYNIMLDHCSLTWASDENLTIYAYDQEIHSITAQNSIISEGLYRKVSSSNDHAAGPTIGSVERADLVYDISIIRNLMSHNQFRNPYAKNKNVEIVNNLVYHWERWGMMIRGGITADIIGNKFRVGEGFEAEDWKTDRGIRYTSPGDNGNYGIPGDPSIYLEGNVDDYFPDPAQDNWDMIEQTSNVFTDKGKLDIKYRRYARQTFAPWPAIVYSIQEVEWDFLPLVGASGRLNAEGELVPNQDPVDARLIDQYLTSTATYRASVAEAGGYPLLASGAPYADTDRDGMSDVWEVANGFDENDASDGNQDADDDGYTNVEEFLNGTVPTISVPTSTYTIRARGLQGTEEMALLIGGETVQSWTVSKSMQNYSYTGSETGTVRVAITNDQGKGHDLVVDKLTVDGTVYQAKEQVINTGVWQKGSCGGSYSQWLHCSGYIEFDTEPNNARQADQPTKEFLTELLPNVRLFPNPSPDGSFTVQGIAEGSQVRMYDLQGRDIAVSTQTLAPQRLQVQPRRDLSKGLYLLRVQQVDGKGWQGKVAVE